MLVKALQQRDDRRAEQQRELAALTGRQRVTAIDVDQIVCNLRKRLDAWRRTLRRHAPIARQILLRLIVDRLVFVPGPVARLPRFSGTATLGDLLEGVIGIPGKSAVPQVWRARRDAIPTVQIDGVVKVA